MLTFFVSVGTKNNFLIDSKLLIWNACVHITSDQNEDITVCFTEWLDNYGPSRIPCNVILFMARGSLSALQRKINKEEKTLVRSTDLRESNLHSSFHVTFLIKEE